jgi:hypothetical protein
MASVETANVGMFHHIERKQGNREVCTYSLERHIYARLYDDDKSAQMKVVRNVEERTEDVLQQKFYSGAGPEFGR